MINIFEIFGGDRELEKSFDIRTAVESKIKKTRQVIVPAIYECPTNYLLRRPYSRATYLARPSPSATQPYEKVSHTKMPDLETEGFDQKRSINKIVSSRLK